MKIFFMGILCVVVTGCSSVVDFGNGITGTYLSDGEFMEGWSRFRQGGDEHGYPYNSPGPDFVYEPGVLENPDLPYGPNNRFVGDSWYDSQTNTRVAWTLENYESEQRAAKKRWRAELASLRAIGRDSTSIPPQYARKKNKQGKKAVPSLGALESFNRSGFNFRYNNPARPVNPFTLPKYQNVRTFWHGGLFVP